MAGFCVAMKTEGTDAVADAGRKRRWAIAVAALGLTVASLGVLPLFLEHLTQGNLNAFDVNGIRYVIAALMALPGTLWLSRTLSPAERGRLWRRAAIPALAYVATQVFYGLAPYYNNATMLNFGARLSIPFTTLFGFCLVARERALMRSKRFWSGLAVAVVGFVTMFSSGLGTDSTSPQGMAIMAVFAVGWGLYVACVGRFLHDYSPILSFGAVVSIACPFHVLLLVLFGHPAALMSIGGAEWFSLVVSSFLGLVLANVLVYRAMIDLGPITSDASMLLVPFVTAVLAHAFLGEALKPWQWVAGVVLMVGCALLIAARFHAHHAHHAK